MSQTDEKPWRDKDRLEELYWGERMTQAEIAEELGCAPRTIVKWMDKLDVEVRPGRTTKTVEERFWSYVDKGDPDECWEWQGKTNHNGYGGFALEDRVQINASRAAYILEVEDPGDKHVLHKCDNPPCVNPNHLYAGTRSDNMYDKWERGDGDASGENNPNAHLTWDDVRDIREKQSTHSAKELAQEYDTGQGHIYNIWNHRVWKEDSSKEDNDGSE